MTTIQFRRQLIVILLLCVAAIAAVVRHFAAPDSTVRTVSTVMMLLWLPVIGSIVGWCYGKLRRPPAPDTPPDFAPGQAFQPHALVEITLRESSVPAENIPKQAGEHRCVLVVGSQGFQMRWQLAPGDLLRQGETRQLPMEFLSPQMALPLCPPGTTFRMLVGDSFVGDGRMLRVPA
ncbi:MAG: hypothetical protein QM777_03765 [Pseudorhodoferax sp.]